MPQARQPVAFIATSMPERSKAFYETTIGLTLRAESPFALVFDDHGITLRVQIVRDHQPQSYTAHGWEVADIATEMSRLAECGVTFQRFEHLEQSEQGVWTTPDGHKIAWFCDPDGNILSLTQFTRP